MRSLVLSIMSLYFFALSDLGLSATTAHKDFPAVMRLLSEMESALLICFQGEVLAVQSKALHDLAPHEKNSRLLNDVSAQAQKCALNAHVTSQSMYAQAAKELERNAPALAKLKDLLSVFLSMMTGVPRLQISYHLIAKEQQRDKQLFQEKAWGI
jgi:hypothetical protein